jgi:hypothetical protein
MAVVRIGDSLSDVSRRVAQCERDLHYLAAKLDALRAALDNEREDDE